ncbi:OmpA family protein [Mucilaginibacter auburnensis]|uniref:OOP family OmpA-OmpF porin n=1 Tax=Mucilaginibacter auburnensis TaxID=1457233 RepID=A0A2H9VPA0_9SPHI|nr:OmpA family protein [Mucilaginibacter auburnensis]PJJ80143.1 OOP family OmpA-OmpF porin [Mucilaginibacter auburnensis]
MNYSTLKKTVAFSFASLLVAGAVNAQTTATGSTTSNAKMFGGTGQFRTWSIGINGGVTSPMLFTGGSSDFNGNKISLGYGISVRKQLSYAFSLEASVTGGKVQGNSGSAPFVGDGVTGNRFVSFSTDFFQYGINGVINIANINFLKRERGIIFYGKAGWNLINYKPTMVAYNPPAGTPLNQEYPNRVTELVLPIGVGTKFRLSDVVALNVGYTQNFIDGDNFDAVRRSYPTKDRYAYGYAGLEFTLGSKDKPALEFTNPVALMYDELYDAALRREVEALKGRVTNVENAVNDLKKDSDGDGVADQFDKCPGTPAGTVVDGGGCPIVFPKQDTVAASPAGAAYSNIQFEFDSSVLRTSSYPALDATSADLRTSGSAVEVQGFASSEGTAAHNLKLSRDRANSVKTYLVNSGVAASKITVKGFGETQPIADNSTEEGRVLNRRVQFKK